MQAPLTNKATGTPPPTQGPRGTGVPGTSHGQDGARHCLQGARRTDARVSSSVGDRAGAAGEGRVLRDPQLCPLPPPHHSTLKPRNTCPILPLDPASPGGRAPMCRGVLDCSPWELGQGGANPSARSRPVPSILRPRDLGQPGAGWGPLCLPAGRWAGKANDRGPAPARPIPLGAELGLRSSRLARPHPHAPGHSVSSPCLGGPQSD